MNPEPSYMISLFIQNLTIAGTLDPWTFKFVQLEYPCSTEASHKICWPSFHKALERLTRMEILNNTMGDKNIFTPPFPFETYIENLHPTYLDWHGLSLL